MKSSISLVGKRGVVHSEASNEMEEWVQGKIQFRPFMTEKNKGFKLIRKVLSKKVARVQPDKRKEFELRGFIG